MDPVLNKKTEELFRALQKREKLLVAFSGGVDSSLLLYYTQKVLPHFTHAAMLISPLVSESDIISAKNTAEMIGAPISFIEFPALRYAKIRDNNRERCYYCKKEGVYYLAEEAHKHGISCIADGLNTSDLKEYRPGTRATDECGVIHPFIEAGLSKEEIRELARLAGIPVFNKPSSACLATRVPYGVELTEENLSMVDRAEEIMRGIGYHEVRVRNHERLARIELPLSSLESAIQKREEIFTALKKIGFIYVTIDLQGFRSGSMDEIIQ